MTTTLTSLPAHTRGTTGRLAQFCRDMLRQLPRSDQRRWGEVYVRGLVSLTGRKSVKRMTDHIAEGRADQGIQQFVNQSPWDWTAVRHDLAHHAESLFRPRAWVMDEVAFPKNGSNSVGVARQYAPSAGRVMNCQLGFGMFLAGDDAAAAVNWRLLLPASWDGDETRRARTRLPDSERNRSRWQYLAETLDEMSIAWELLPVPVVVNARHEHDVAPLLRLLEQRGHSYLVGVAPGAVLSDDAVLAAGHGGVSLNWRDGGTPGPASRFTVQPLSGRPRAVTPMGTLRPRSVLTERVPGQRHPADVWVTNLPTRRLPELISLTRTQRRVAAEMSLLRESYGLHHFEGRSFRGWHHHLTLVSTARLFVLGQELRSRERGELHAYPA